MAMVRKKHNDIGLEASPPKAGCSSDKCPWHGHLKVRGRIFKGKVVASKALHSATVGWDYYKFVPKYERYERRKTRLAALNPACIAAKEGETVLIGECRPLSKSKRFVIIEKM